MLQNAKRHQQLGDNALHARNPRAVEYYRIAIDLLERALRLVQDRTPRTLLEQAKNYYEELQAQAHEIFSYCGADNAKQIFKQAKKQSKSAEEALRKNELTVALQLYNSANRLLLRAIDLCRSQTSEAGKIKTDLQQLFDYLERAEEKVTAAPNPRARILLRQARKMARRAEKASNRDNSGNARRFMTQSRKLLDQILRDSPRPVNDFSARCEATLLQLESDLNEIEQRMTASKNHEAKHLIKLARNAYLEAEKTCQRQKHSTRVLAAFRMRVRMAHQLILKAETILQDSGTKSFDPNNLQLHLQQLDATMKEVRSNLTNDPTGFAQTLFKQATTMRDRAWAAYRKRQYVVAQETSAIAAELLREALKLSK